MTPPIVLDTSLRTLAWRCHPDGCPRDRTCCVGLVVEVSRREVRVIDGNGEVTTFAARRLPERGRYAVTVTFPESGLWTWEVTQGEFGTHPMGPISVSPGVAVPETTASPLAWLLPLALAITIGLVAVQTVNLARQRRRPQPIRAD